MIMSAETEASKERDRDLLHGRGLSRVAVIGPFSALLAVPTAIVPQDMTGLATVFFTSSSLLLLGVLGSYTGVPIFSNAADAVIDRAVNVRRNWENDTLRSFLEVLGWLFMTFEIQAAANNMFISASVGALVGFALVAIGDALTSALRVMEARLSDTSMENVKFWKFGTIATPELLACTGVLVFGVLLRLRDVNTVTAATTTTLLASLSLVTLGQLLMQWEPTHRIGMIVHDRLINLSENWRVHTLRSCFETSAWLAATWQSFALLEDTISAGIIGAVAGLFLCVIGEMLLTTSPDEFLQQQQAHQRVQELREEEYMREQQELRKLQLKNDGNQVTQDQSLRNKLSKYSLFHRSSSTDIARDSLNANEHEHENEHENENGAGGVVLVWREQAGKAGKYPRYYPSAAERKAQKNLIECNALEGKLKTVETGNKNKNTNNEQDLSSPSDTTIDGGKGAATVLTANTAAKYPWKQYSREEVAKHHTREDAWVIIDERVYDVTPYVNSHPGGWLPLSHVVGRDATDAFMQYHPAHVYKLLLPRFCIGELCKEQCGVSDFVNDMRLIREELLRRGMFETSTRYYVLKSIWLVVLLAASICCCLFGESTIVRVFASASLMGLFWQQLAFVGHDLGHNSVSHVMKKDAFWGGLIGNAIGGIALSWWRRNHNTHHVVCNSVEHDPDIQHPPLFAVSDKVFNKPFWSTYYEKHIQIDDVFRALVSKQHWLFYPVMMLARFNLYAQSWILLLSSKKVLYRRSQIFSLSLFPVWIGFLLYSLDTPAQRISWLLLSHAIAGILHVQICISHFPMEHYHGEAYSGKVEDEWYRLQLRTTMDVDCPEYMDWFHGGLQFQVEHHMFPRAPRHNLREVRRILKRVCEKHGVEYHEASFFESNRMLVSSMREVAKKASSLQKGSSGFYESPLWEGFNAIG